MTTKPFTIHTQELRAWCKEEQARIEAGLSTKYHAILCDPPYLIDFLSADWDGACSAQQAQELFKSWGKALLPLLYPGALVLMFGGTRMWHRLASGMEDAGYEIWDTIMWLYGQGFPKSHEIANDIDKSKGNGPRGRAIPTASPHLPGGKYKPGGEKLTSNIVPPYDPKEEEAKPWKGWKTPALKPAWEPVLCFRASRCGKTFAKLALDFGSGCLNIDGTRIGERYPANLMLDETTSPMLEQSRFFYCAKASRSEREAGLSTSKGESANNHPCVKPINLTKYLATFLLPPASVKNRRLLVPFSGSGSEMIGALQAGWDEVVGVEKDERYCRLAENRVKHWISKENKHYPWRNAMNNTSAVLPGSTAPVEAVVANYQTEQQIVDAILALREASLEVSKMEFAKLFKQLQKLYANGARNAQFGKRVEELGFARRTVYNWMAEYDAQVGHKPKKESVPFGTNTRQPKQNHAVAAKSRGISERSSDHAIEEDLGDSSDVPSATTHEPAAAANILSFDTAEKRKTFIFQQAVRALQAGNVYTESLRKEWDEVDQRVRQWLASFAVDNAVPIHDINQLQQLGQEN